MREIQLYIKDPSDSSEKRVDLFDNETIEITQKVKDVRDISKVFTDFTMPFKIPASDRNNKLFKHVYNHSITGTNSFDARVRHEAIIYINHLLFKRGRIFLSDTELKDGKPVSYSVVFYGNLIQLNDILRDDKLYNLYTFDVANDPDEQLIKFNHTYGHSEIKTIFSGTGHTVNSDSKALIYPLITSKKRLFYNSTLGNTDVENFNGNLYRPDSITGVEDRYQKRGVTEEDLKPAIRVKHIIAAIEKKYNINFVGDFLSDNNAAFEDLYLWLSNNSGNITKSFDQSKYLYVGDVTGYTYNSGDDFNDDWLSFDGKVVKITDMTQRFGRWGGIYYLFVNLTVDGDYDDVPWRLRMIDADNNQVIAVTEGTGGGRAMVNDLTILGDRREKVTMNFYLEFSSKTPMESTVVQLEFKREENDLNPFTEAVQENYYNASSLDTNTANLVIKDHIPDIKVIDFLDGLFKMFNLTAVYVDDETDSDYSATTPAIRVITLDDYYANAGTNQSNGTIDITKYVDNSRSTISTILPFSEVDMKFEKTDSILMENHLDLSGSIFGNSTLLVQDLYKEQNKYVLNFGDKYEVKVPFGKLKYERLRSGDEDFTDIQWGYAAGGDIDTKDADYSDGNDIVPPQADYKSINIKPLLFYGIRETSITENINFTDASSSQSSAIKNYYRPSNSDGTGDDATAPDNSINFDSEIDEWLTTIEGTNSLFEKYYKKYIRTIFDKDKRMLTIEAYFPPSFLIHYRLNDQLKIHDVVYRINSIKTNLNTGRSKLELINLNSDEIL